jgi:hypothetical protein
MESRRELVPCPTFPITHQRQQPSAQVRGGGAGLAGFRLLNSPQLWTVGSLAAKLRIKSEKADA